MNKLICLCRVENNALILQKTPGCCCRTAVDLPRSSLEGGGVDEGVNQTGGGGVILPEQREQKDADK